MCQGIKTFQKYLLSFWSSKVFVYDYIHYPNWKIIPFDVHYLTTLCPSFPLSRALPQNTIGEHSFCHLFFQRKGVFQGKKPQPYRIPFSLFGNVKLHHVFLDVFFSLLQNCFSRPTWYVSRV